MKVNILNNQFCSVFLKENHDRFYHLGEAPTLQCPTSKLILKASPNSYTNSTLGNQQVQTRYLVTTLLWQTNPRISTLAPIWNNHQFLGPCTSPTCVQKRQQNNCDKLQSHSLLSAINSWNMLCIAASKSFWRQTKSSPKHNMALENNARVRPNCS